MGYVLLFIGSFELIWQMRVARPGDNEKNTQRA